MSPYIRVSPDALKERWVCYTDLLGFKSLVQTKSWVHVFAAYSRAVEIVAQSESFQDRVRYTWFSDSFIMYTTDGSFQSFASIDQMARRFVYFLLTANTPLRGSLAYGEYYADKDNGIYFGKALIEAYEYGEGQDWIGLIQCPSAVTRLVECGLDVHQQLNYPYWRVPFKAGRYPDGLELPAYRIGEHFKTDGVNPCLSALKGMAAKYQGTPFAAKYTHTIQFIEGNQLRLSPETTDGAGRE